MKLEFNEEQQDRPPIDVDLYNTYVTKIMALMSFKEDPKDKRKLDRFINESLDNFFKGLSYTPPGAFTTISLTISDMAYLNDSGVLSEYKTGSAIDKSKQYVSKLKIIGQEKLLSGKEVDLYVFHPTTKHLLTYFKYCFNSHKGNLMPRDLFFFTPMGLINKDNLELPELDAAKTMITGTYGVNNKWKDFSHWMKPYNKSVNNTFSRSKYLIFTKMMIAMMVLKIIWDEKNKADLSESSILNHAEFILSDVNHLWFYS